MVYHPRLMTAVLGCLRARWRSLLVLHLFFAGLGVAAFIPLTTVLANQLIAVTGQPVISNEDLLLLAFTPRGWLLALGAGSLALTLMFVQTAGILLTVEVHGHHRYHAAMSALVQVLRHLPRILVLALLQVASHLIAALPFMLLIGGLGWFLLSGYDPYYLVNEWPTAMWLFAGGAGVLLCGMILGNGALYLRWVLALPSLLFEQLSPWTALRRSQALTRGYRSGIALLLLASALLTLLLPLGFTVLFRDGAALALNWIPAQMALVVTVMLLVIVSYLLLGTLLTFLAVSWNSLLIRQLYLRAVGIRKTTSPQPAGKLTGWLSWGAEALILLFVLGQAGLLINDFLSQEEDVLVIAHRGSSINAPENTLSAIELAIAEGADYVEVDVRQTADGALVLLHDRDLRRLGGPGTPVWNLTLEQVQSVDVGRWHSTDFAGERVPTLEEVIDAVRGRAGLYLEIKPGPQSPDLTADTLALLAAEDMLDDTILAALDKALLQRVQDRQPDLRRAVFVHSVVGRPDYSSLHAVGKRAALVNRSTVTRARRNGHELHVWTVNDETDMGRFIDMGVDGIITDRPDVLTRVLTERADLSRPELLLLKLANWLR
ncbi:MAG: glycerophosphoryl diester phosphodiesterase membrane domain-containing protein [Natronospirillum sp.]|uniref:glycerophosphodiester phosphodiesterase family protein n=1 Tax=Natronospirillum sp. TaxID=2812955 RepID=UPI0025EEBB6B|nr:glycerophosphodiester phosphodiesterase family protein [Natronospirillum sp.]MCH8551127.1 glycerophosphoryl diester phosphodiesterase membrane domain-containing protein [Natronospirillum sp.]